VPISLSVGIAISRERLEERQGGQTHLGLRWGTHKLGSVTSAAFWDDISLKGDYYGIPGCAAYHSLMFCMNVLMRCCGAWAMQGPITGLVNSALFGATVIDHVSGTCRTGPGVYAQTHRPFF